MNSTITVRLEPNPDSDEVYVLIPFNICMNEKLGDVVKAAIEKAQGKHDEDSNRNTHGCGAV